MPRWRRASAPAISTRTASRSLSRLSPNSACWMRCIALPPPRKWRLTAAERENFHSRQKMSLPVAGRGEYQWILTTEDGKQYQGKPAAARRCRCRPNCRRGTTPDPHPGGSAGTAELSSRQRCYEPQPLKEEKAVGHLRAAVYPALREKLGSAILAICGPCCRKSPAAAGRLLALTRFMPSIRRTRRAPAYSPSSRRWLNVIYIDVNAVEDFQRSEEAQAWWQSPATQQALQAARNGRCGLYRRHYAENDRAAYGMETILSS